MKDGQGGRGMMKREELVCIAEEFSKWLADMAKRYNTDEDNIQEIIKSFLM